MKKNKIIKLTEEQFKQIINEDYPDVSRLNLISSTI